ncbi:hypothetical protein N7532_008718 [Penicillium argentinense]|uniref:Uncharacterized protein n=1 Tax=Penicillium argentinense TaxID=1131581 RepID=A0A9W9EXX7_9EURO|nr:uncharacterized protein N7532_008718 [Penicillium argentinense]KAJ5090034.1 hypothetical protein N7532_008718 [Penicillium argentinense]
MKRAQLVPLDVDTSRAGTPAPGSSIGSPATANAGAAAGGATTATPAPGNTYGTSTPEVPPGLNKDGYSPMQRLMDKLKKKRKASPSQSTRKLGPFKPKLASDPLKRKYLNYEDLDLDKSYVDEAPKQPRKAKKRVRPRKNWNHTGAEPITEIDDIPKGWDHIEYDLAEECHERIAERIMPDVFKTRLERFEELKKER